MFKDFACIPADVVKNVEETRPLVESKDQVGHDENTEVHEDKDHDENEDENKDENGDENEGEDGHEGEDDSSEKNISILNYAPPLIAAVIYVYLLIKLEETVYQTGGSYS